MVSILTCALSLFDSDTYVLLDVRCSGIPAARITRGELRRSPVDEALDCRQRREACRSEVEARCGIIEVDRKKCGP